MPKHAALQLNIEPALDLEILAPAGPADRQILPSDVRPRAYAGVELLLDTLHAARAVFDFDLESLVIYLSIAEATMRPLMLASSTANNDRGAERGPPGECGSISRLLVADRTGLSRETVRRKINALLAAGHLCERATGQVHVKQVLDDPRVQEATAASFAAVKRYNSRLLQLGRPGVV